MKIINVKQLVSTLILAGIGSLSFASEEHIGHNPYYTHPSYGVIHDYVTGYSGYGYRGHEYSGRPYVGHGYFNTHTDISYYPDYRPIHRERRIIRSEIHLPGFSLNLHL